MVFPILFGLIIFFILVTILHGVAGFFFILLVDFEMFHCGGGGGRFLTFGERVAVTCDM